MTKSLFLRTLGALCVCTVASAGTLERMELEVGGEMRQFSLFTPSSYDPAVPMPLVFGLHGFTVNVDTHQLITNMNSVAEDKGVLVAYPQAIENNWFPGVFPMVGSLCFGFLNARGLIYRYSPPFPALTRDVVFHASITLNHP